MRLQLVLLICFCLIALSVAKKGKKKGTKHNGLKARRKICDNNLEVCLKMGGGPKWKSTCIGHFIACKGTMKKRSGKKHGGDHKKRSGAHHHFCHCFKKLFGHIKKHHSKTKIDSDGQKVTVHEKIFNIAQSAVDGSKGDLVVVNGRPNKMNMNAMKKCFMRPFYCHSHKNCGRRRGVKRRGKKSKRKHRGVEFMFGKSRKDKKMGKRPWEKKSPLVACVVNAKKCKEQAGGRKKQIKACAKAFFKCVQDVCKG